DCKEQPSAEERCTSSLPTILRWQAYPTSHLPTCTRTSNGLIRPTKLSKRRCTSLWTANVC
ncbi:unnamed protein product, partial [Ectocarpus fasciculatus]